MTLNTNRQPGDVIESSDVNSIAEGVNTIRDELDQTRTNLDTALLGTKAVENALGITTKASVESFTLTNRWPDPYLTGSSTLLTTRASITKYIGQIVVTATEAVPSGLGVAAYSQLRINFPPAEEVYISVKARLITGDPTVGVMIQFLTGTTSAGSIVHKFVGGSEFREFNARIPVPAGADNFRIYLGLADEVAVGDAIAYRELMVATADKPVPLDPVRFFSGDTLNVYSSDDVVESYSWTGATNASESVSSLTVTSYDVISGWEKGDTLSEKFLELSGAKSIVDVTDPDIDFRMADKFSIHETGGRYFSTCNKEEEAEKFIASNLPTWVSSTATSSGTGAQDNPMTFTAAMAAKKPLLMMAPGEYFLDTATVPNSATSHDYAMVGVGPGVKLTGYYKEPTYSVSGDVLVFDVVGTGVVDNNLTHAIDGVKLTYSKATSVETVNAPGLWFSDGTKTYVYPKSGTTASDLRISGNARSGFYSMAGTVISKNVTFEGNWGTCLSSGVGVFIGIDSRFNYSPIGNGLNILGGESYTFRCEASGNLRDGFNYHESGGKLVFFYEDACYGTYNGMTMVNMSSNGSTAHESAVGVRVNCRFENCYGGIVADVNSASTFNYGLEVHRDYEPYSRFPHIQAEGSAPITDKAHIRLIGCQTTGPGVYFQATTGAAISIKKMRMSDDNKYLTATSGSITFD